jgi:hypothetical protein
MAVNTTTMLAILRRQLDPTLQMLADIVDGCPTSSWLDSRSGRPFWQQVLHALTGVCFWLREASQPFSPPDFGRGAIPDLDQAPTFDVDKGTVKAYLASIRRTADLFFDTLDDQKLLATSSLYDKCTYADLILGQIRHIQHHVGYCNCLLQSSGARPTKWLGYAE